MSKEHIIDRITPGSIAEELEIEVGDVLVSINGNEIEDVFDYHYMVNDEYLEILIRKADGEEWELEIEKEYNEDIGIEFENGLMDDYKSCTNKCIFCFIDQMPPGMRETLYFKDDDSRLSFLQLFLEIIHIHIVLSGSIVCGNDQCIVIQPAPK